MNQMNLEVLKGLKERYRNIHPLIFQRSLERATSETDLFDILYKIPNLPIVWNEKDHCWAKENDILCIKKLKEIKKRKKKK